LETTQAWDAVRAISQEVSMTENGPRRRPRQLSPEEKWQVFLEVCSQQLSQADAARKWGVDVSTVIKLRRLAKDGALAAFAASRPGKPVSIEQLEIADLRAENDRLSEALKELAVELALHRGRQRSGFSARSPFA
jgi:transposase-like protein